MRVFRCAVHLEQHKTPRARQHPDATPLVVNAARLIGHGSSLAACVRGASETIHMLTPDELNVLRFADTHPWQYNRIEEDIRRELRMSPVRYYQVLLGACRGKDAEEAYPALVHRVRRMVVADRDRRAERARVRRLA